MQFFHFEASTDSITELKPSLFQNSVFTACMIIHHGTSQRILCHISLYFSKANLILLFIGINTYW